MDDNEEDPEKNVFLTRDSSEDKNPNLEKKMNSQPKMTKCESWDVARVPHMKRMIFHNKSLQPSNDTGKDDYWIETNHKDLDEEMMQNERLLEHEHTEETTNNTKTRMAKNFEGDSIDILNRMDHDMNQSCDAVDSTGTVTPVAWLCP